MSASGECVGVSADVTCVVEVCQTELSLSVSGRGRNSDQDRCSDFESDLVAAHTCWLDENEGCCHESGSADSGPDETADSVTDYKSNKNQKHTGHFPASWFADGNDGLPESASVC